MMKHGNWVPIDARLARFLPRDRAYSEVEALYCLQLNYDKGSDVTVAGLASAWGWTRKKTARFLKTACIEIVYSKGKGSRWGKILVKEPPEGVQVGVQVRDRLGTGEGQVRLIKNKHLDDERDRLGTGEGQVRDRLRPTINHTSYSYPKEEYILSENSDHTRRENGNESTRDRTPSQRDGEGLLGAIPSGRAGLPERDSGEERSSAPGANVNGSNKLYHDLTQGQPNEELDQSKNGAMGFEQEGEDGNTHEMHISGAKCEFTYKKRNAERTEENTHEQDEPRVGGHGFGIENFNSQTSPSKPGAITAGGGPGEAHPSAGGIPQNISQTGNRVSVEGKQGPFAAGGGSGEDSSEQCNPTGRLEELGSTSCGEGPRGGQVNDNLEAPTSDPVKPAAKTEEGPRYRTRKKRWLKGARLDGFEQFWKIFDDKRSKAAAADSWFDLEDYSPDLVKAILHGARMYAQDRQDILLSKGTPKMAQGWLTDRRWEDYVADDGERKGDGEIDVQARIKAARERSRKIKEEEARNGKVVQPPALAIVGKNSGTDTQSKGHGFANPALQRLFG